MTKPPAPEAAKVVFRHSVEAFLDHVLVKRGLMLPDLVKELAAMGIDPRRARDVTIGEFYKLVELAASRLGPGRTREANLEEVGRAMLRGYVDSLVGRGILIGARMMGPRRTLLRMAENFKTADNVTRITTAEPAPNTVDINLSPDGGVPDYHRGLFSEVFVVLGVRQYKVESRPSAFGALHRMSWEP
jgi:uncharacterized protein (TIGR02265 family)